MARSSLHELFPSEIIRLATRVGTSWVPERAPRSVVSDEDWLRFCCADSLSGLLVFEATRKLLLNSSITLCISLLETLRKQRKEMVILAVVREQQKKVGAGDKEVYRRDESCSFDERCFSFFSA